MQKILGRAAAWLFLLGLLTGGLIPQVMNGTLDCDAHSLLASHLNALLGCFLLLGVGSTLPLLRYGEAGRRRLAWAFIVAGFANWSITAVKARLHVSGLGWTGERANDAIFLLLTAFVVVPSLAASVAWIAGFHGDSRE